MNKELEKFKIQIKEQIASLINKDQLIEAKGLVEEYKKIVSDDIEIYSMEAVILIMQNKLDQAELILKEGLYLDKDNFDLNYNLAYVNEKNLKFNNAHKYYNIALKNCSDEDAKNDLVNIIKNIEDEYNIISIEEKQKIAFFVKKGMDSFLWDIINELSEKYETKKIIVTDYKQIDEGMHWADICWFEWCDELVIYGSKLSVAKQKRIICRIHGYEVYTNYIKETNWKNVDQLIIVAPHIRKIFEENTKEIDKGSVKINTVFCGINIDKYPLNKKNKGFNIGYLGYINFKKNIPLTLDIFKKLYDMDNRYKLHIGGEFQDERTLSYLKYFIKENKLENSFVFHGWLNQNEKNKFFENIDYMIISSIDEGLCFAAAEAMTSGIKPILHNCEGIKDHYDKKYIFNTVDKAIEMIIDEEYDSKEYRSFIEKKYSLSREVAEINQIIKDIDMKKEKDSIDSVKIDFNYKEYWEERYKNGGNSGYGSYGKLAEFKADIVNTLICENNIKNVIEFGCGDGNQLKYMQYENYIGLDISQNVIEKCNMIFRNDTNKGFLHYIPGEILNNRLENVDMVISLDVLYHIINEEDFVKTLDDIFSISAEVVVLYTILEEPKVELADHVKYRDMMKYLNKYKNYSINKIIKQKYSDDSFADFIILKKKRDVISINYIEEAINSLNNFSYSMKELIDKFKFNNSDIAIGKLEKLSENYLLIECIITNKSNKQIILTGIILDMYNDQIIYPEYIRESKKLNEVDVITKKIIRSEINKLNGLNIHGFIYDKEILRDIESNQLAYNWERGIPGTQFMPLLGYLNVILRYELAGKYIDENDIVLEAACGFGYGAAYLASICKQVEAVDIAKDNIEFAQRTYSFENINWIEGDVTKLPYADNTFDKYINYETLEHIPLNLVEIYIEEAARVIKEDGKFIISTPNEVNRKNVNNPFHIKEYNFIEFNNLLKKYFENIDYYSLEGNILTNGISNGSNVMIAIAYNL